MDPRSRWCGEVDPAMRAKNLQNRMKARARELARDLATHWHEHADRRQRLRQLSEGCGAKRRNGIGQRHGQALLLGETICHLPGRLRRGESPRAMEPRLPRERAVRSRRTVLSLMPKRRGDAVGVGGMMMRVHAGVPLLCIRFSRRPSCSTPPRRRGRESARAGDRYRWSACRHRSGGRVHDRARCRPPRASRRPRGCRRVPYQIA